MNNHRLSANGSAPRKSRPVLYERNDKFGVIVDQNGLLASISVVGWLYTTARNHMEYSQSELQAIARQLVRERARRMRRARRAMREREASEHGPALVKETRVHHSRDSRFVQRAQRGWRSMVERSRRLFGHVRPRRFPWHA